jgi:hypothetical protein
VSALGGFASHIGDNKAMSGDDVRDVATKAAVSALNRGVGMLAGGEALGAYSLIPDVAGEYTLQNSLNNSTPLLPW